MANQAAEKAAGADQASPSASAAPQTAPKAPPWEWSIEGVLVNGSLFTFAPVKPGQVQEYSDRLLEIMAAWALMLRTRRALEAGELLNHENAWEKARLFSRDFIAAQRALEATVAGIGVFFEPTGVASGIRAAVLKDFVDEALQKLSERG